MPTITNYIGVFCILFLMFFFPIMHGLARLVCFLAMPKRSRVVVITKGGR